MKHHLSEVGFSNGFTKHQTSTPPAKLLFLGILVFGVALGGIMLFVKFALYSRKVAHGRAFASAIIAEVQHIEAAKDQYAFETKSPISCTPRFVDLIPYLKPGSDIINNHGNDSLGNPFVIGPLSARPRVSALTQTNLLTALGGTVFWGPYS